MTFGNDFLIWKTYEGRSYRRMLLSFREHIKTGFPWASIIPQRAMTP